MPRLIPLFILLLIPWFGISQELVLDYNQGSRGLEVNSARKIGSDWYFIVEDGHFYPGLIKTNSQLNTSDFVRRFDVPTDANDELALIGTNVYLFTQDNWSVAVTKYSPSNSSTLLKQYSQGSIRKVVQGKYFIIYQYWNGQNGSSNTSYHYIDNSGHEDLNLQIPNNFQLLGKMDTNVGTVVLFRSYNGIRAYHFIEGQEAQDVSLAFNYLWDSALLGNWIVEDLLILQSEGEIHFWKWDNTLDDFSLFHSDITFAEKADFHYNSGSREVYLSTIFSNDRIVVDWFDLATKERTRLGPIWGIEITGAWKDNIISRYDNIGFDQPHFLYANGESQPIEWIAEEIMQSVSAGKYLLATMDTPETGVETFRIDVQTGELINVFDLRPGPLSGLSSISVAPNNYYCTDEEIYLFADNGIDGNNLYEYSLTNHFLQPHESLSNCNKGSDIDFFIIDETFYSLTAKPINGGWTSSIWEYDYDHDDITEAFSIEERLSKVGKIGEKVICASSTSLLLFTGDADVQQLLTPADLDISTFSIFHAELIGDLLHIVNKEGNQDIIYRYNLITEELIKIKPDNSNSYVIQSFYQLAGRIVFMAGRTFNKEIRHWPIEATAPQALPNIDNSSAAMRDIHAHDNGQSHFFFVKRNSSAPWEVWGQPNYFQDFELLISFPDQLNIFEGMYSGQSGNIFGNGAGLGPDYPLDAIWKYDLIKNEISIPNATQSYLLEEVKAVLTFADEEYLIIEKVTGENYVLAKLDESSFDLLHHFPTYYYDITPQGNFGNDFYFGFRQEDSPGGLYRINVEDLEFEKINTSYVIPQDFRVTDNTKKYRDQLHVVAFESCTDEEWWRFVIPGYPVGVGEIATQNNFVKLGPNPTTEQVHVELKTVEEAQLEIYNATGQLIKNQAVRNGVEIDLSGEAAGLYYFKFKKDDWQTTEKIILLK